MPKLSADPNALYRGREAADRGDYREAIYIVTEALGRHCAPKLMARLLATRAASYVELRIQTEDEAFLDMALSDCKTVWSFAKPGSSSYNYTLGVGMAIFMIQRDYDQAVEKAKEGLLLAKDAAAEEVAFEYLGLAMSARRAQREETEPKENPEEQRVSGLLKQMSSQAPHEVLGVRENATRLEVNRAYHLLAKIYHPDKPGGDPRLFQLLDEAKRKLYQDA